MKSLPIGEAAHIVGEKPGAARHDPTMSDEQRAHISNAIWLCPRCHTLVDKDPSKYTVELLSDWRLQAEQWSSSQLDAARTSPFVVEFDEQAGYRCDDTMRIPSIPLRAWTLLQRTLGSHAIVEFRKTRDLYESRFKELKLDDSITRAVVHVCLEAEGFKSIANSICASADYDEAGENLGFCLKALSGPHTSIVGHQIKRAVAAICATGQLLPWRSERILGVWLDQRGKALALGHHWVLALAALSGSGDVFDAICSRQPADHWRTHGNRANAEHAVLNIGEGLCAFLVALAERRRISTSPKMGELAPRLDLCLKWMDFEYFNPRVLEERQSELRLAFGAIRLFACAAACVVLELKEQAEVCRSLANGAISRISSVRVSRAAMHLGLLLEERRIGWDILPQLMMPGGSYESTRSRDPSAHEALHEAYMIVVDHRDNYDPETSPGWRSWLGYFETVGMISSIEAMRELSRRAQGMESPARS